MLERERKLDSHTTDVYSLWPYRRGMDMEIERERQRGGEGEREVVCKRERESLRKRERESLNEEKSMCVTSLYQTGFHLILFIL